MASRRNSMETVHSWDDVPKFDTAEEEAAYWGTHELGEEVLDRLDSLPQDVLPPPRSRTRPVAVRFDDSTIKRIKVIAARRHKGYQTLLKEFVVERLYEEEKREGLVG